MLNGRGVVGEREMRERDLLIVGAGPYGLSTAAYAQHRGLDFLMVGKPMDFWNEHMPNGMFLRSGREWHLDPMGVHTLDAYLQARGLDERSTQPLPVELFRDYAAWFQAAYGLKVRPSLVQDLSRADGVFEARLDDGETVRARGVLLALGFASFMNTPSDLAGKLPAGRYTHTWNMVDFERVAGQSFLIVGGRQSAYEWAALLAEAGAARIHVSHRHPMPRFAEADWTWVEDMLRLSATVPGWFRGKSAEEQEQIRLRFWGEGRSKLEPWLASRITRDSVHMWAGTSLVSAHERPNGKLDVALDVGVSLEVDHVILATGYRVDVTQVGLLSRPTLLPDLRTADGFPVLDESFQSSVPGLYFTGLPATRDFGPFFGFCAGCRVSPALVVESVIAKSTVAA